MLLNISLYWLSIEFGKNAREFELLFSPVLAFLIVAFALPSSISAILGDKVHCYLGKISMHIYLWHYVIINFGGKQLLQKILGGSDNMLIVSLLILFVSTIIISAISDKAANMLTNKKIKDQV